MKYLSVLVLLGVIATSVVTAQNKVVCYFGSWATYRPGNGKFDVETLPPNLCTHAIYSFIGVNTDATVRIMDPWNDVTNNGFKRFNNLRLSNPNLKTLIAIGGWSEGSVKFSTVCASSTLRAKFVTNLYNFVKLYKFNGLDLDWEYPSQRGGAVADKANFVLLVKALRAKFAPEGLLLTAAVGATISLVATSYDVPALSTNLDFINLMTYDFHGSWELVTGQNSPLYAATIDTDKSNNVNGTVQYWLKMGAPASKLVLGIGLYGRTWTLKSPTSALLGAAAAGIGTAGPYTQEAGLLGYNEICEMQKQIGWTITFDAQQKVPYASKDTLWVGYDNVESIKIKTEYIKTMKLGGGMVWSVDTDDFKNICGAGAFPLVNQIKSTLAAVVG